jgi:hypothetical protein
MNLRPTSVLRTNWIYCRDNFQAIAALRCHEESAALICRNSFAVSRYHMTIAALLCKTSIERQNIII